MKYVCKVCGYVYDDDKQTVPFVQLPDSWTCPLCGAVKSDFEMQNQGEPAVIKPNTAVKTVKEYGNMRKLSVGQLSAVCSNLARGCEKQYKQEESALFTELAEYFASVTPAAESAEVSDITKALQEDMENGYGDINIVAGNGKDRGALRVSVWGEKVTRILNSLMQKYEKEGESFLSETEIWVCTVCGFVYVGENPPELCPVCKVPSWKFERIERRVK